MVRVAGLVSSVTGSLLASGAGAAAAGAAVPAAGFAAAYLRGGDLAACAAIASANAAFVVQYFGATTGCRPYEDVAALAKSFGYDVP